MTPGQDPEMFENVEEVLRRYFEEFDHDEVDEREKTPSEEGTALADKVVGDLKIRLSHKPAKA